MAVIESKI